MNKDTEKDMVLSINASAEFLGMSRSTFWRKAKSKGFPSKVVINGKAGYLPEDLVQWRYKYKVSPKISELGEHSLDYLGKALFLFEGYKIGRACVANQAHAKGKSTLKAEKQFDTAFKKLKESYLKVAPKGLDDDKVDRSSSAWKDFVEAKKEIINIVWPEIGVDDFTEEEILNF